ncbi:alpha/beta superfamily hydrolase (macronuclear) [Tetrahymena thermophila SB210]|uniref:Alpha/beta superfamily hydrolase n=1 Tax=Tetrahymena thermophila (strain SB210) TaxID=312017 RepID=A4VCR6_TETTS|nr:alpha/beta superfamily hydrolase [Tetrahymena thermophila SB210]EDK31324.2 alpha/beta superfamily hydrolase [Tetrahymena thermophila SB210]|eukprot:XP_001471059.2 alpha/beta superfamily hydrolase [Tetrahymena thermophila SB210]
MMKIKTTFLYLSIHLFIRNQQNIKIYFLILNHFLNKYLLIKIYQNQICFVLIIFSLLKKMITSQNQSQREPTLTEQNILPGRLKPQSALCFDSNRNVLQFIEGQNVFDPTQKVCIPLLLRQSEQKSDICVLYFHGNGEYIDNYIGFMEDLSAENQKTNFVVMEYSGYGLYCDQIISSKQILADSLVAFDYIVSELKFDPNNIIVLGRSIGSGPASYLASKRKCRLVCLVSPFWSIKDWLKDLEQSDQFEDCFNNLNCVKNFQSPCLLIHGKKDTLIPISHSIKLEEELKSLNKHHKVVYKDNWTHNLISFDEIFTILLNYSNEILKP